MALRKNVKSQVETTLPEISIDRGLLSRIEKISEQTGLDTSALLQKWILQEETLIGFMQRSKEQTVTQITPSLEA
ncbi:MAG: hypothetical protein LBS00_05355, partial [Synergistaceae bacterium]|nr:hypothetical protein [Synergistaceae bacterium]